MDLNAANEELMGKYLELSRMMEVYKLDCEQIKQEMQSRLEKDNTHVFKCTIGEARMMNYKKQQFDQKKAKSYLSEEQVKDCTKEIEMKYLTIMSTESLQKRKDFLKMNDDIKKD
jgi:hypothetical protein